MKYSIGIVITLRVLVLVSYIFKRYPALLSKSINITSMSAPSPFCSLLFSHTNGCLFPTVFFNVILPLNGKFLFFFFRLEDQKLLLDAS